MEKNNPLFDLAKIKIELHFLNENLSNFQFENDLILFLNKYLWKIHMNNPNPNNDEIENERSSQFYFFEFYTKNINNRQSNIPDTNLISNKTNFYLDLLFIFETKEEFEKKEEGIKNLINMLSTSNTPRDLTHLLIICNKNLDLNSLTNFLDKSYYDIIELWENNNIKKRHKSFELALKNIVIQYRVNTLNHKFDVSIVNEEEDEEDDKIKRKLEILDAYIKMGNYNKSMKYLETLKEPFKVQKEITLFKECNVVIRFLIDYNNSFIGEEGYKMEFNEEIETGFLDVIDKYRNVKQIYLMINTYIKLLSYLSYFSSVKKKKRTNEIIMSLLNEKIEEEIKNDVCIFEFLNLAHIYNKINFKRKFFLLLYKTYKNYMTYYKNQDSYGNLNYIMFLTKNIEKYFLREPSNNIQNYYNYNYENFIEFSNVIKNYFYKPIVFNFQDDENNPNGEKEENNQLDKRPLYIKGVFNGYQQVFHLILWESLQKKIYNNLMKMYKGIKNYDKTILYCLELLQICYNILPEEKQENLVSIIKSKSSKVKYINYYNVVNVPILLRIIPQASEIKFDCVVNQSINKQDDLFIFNPWNQKNTNSINYYWTVKSIQSIILSLYNPLKIQITISQIQLIYNIKSKTSEHNNLFNYMPMSIVIPPNQKVEYKFYFKPLFEEVFDIIGIEYLFEGIKVKQYVKNDGNGLLFRYKNTIENLYSLKTRDKVFLNNIRIYPEIPLVRLIPLNNELIDDTPLKLFEFQKYTFNFDIINLSDKPIKQINSFVYAYKKDDYKITLQEKILKDDSKINKMYLEPNTQKKFSYEFIQKKSYLKIEFILYLIYDDANENDKNNNDMHKQVKKKEIKPFLFFKKELNYRNLFLFGDPEHNPVYTNINLKKILEQEKNYSKYFTSIISNYYYFTFTAKLLLFLQKKISYEIYYYDKNQDKDVFIDKGEFTKKKRFKLFVDKSNKLSKTIIKWKVLDSDIEGVINLFDLIRNIFNKELTQNFDFNILKEEKEDYIEFTYEVQNNTKLSFFNMKLKILIYQENHKSLNMSIPLEEDIFIDGQLIHIIDEIKPKEKTSVKINVYPQKGTIFNTTFLLIDQKLRVLYIPSFSVNWK